MPEDEQVTALLARAGIAADRVGRHEPLTGGSYNALHTVDLTDGTRLVLKVPPSPDVPRLRYEGGLLHGEALFYESAAAVGVPVPRVCTPSATKVPGRGRGRVRRPGAVRADDVLPG